MKDIRYYAVLDWGRMKLAYEGPLEDLALAEAQRRCIKPHNLKRVVKETRETIYQQEAPSA